LLPSHFVLNHLTTVDKGIIVDYSSGQNGASNGTANRQVRNRSQADDWKHLDKFAEIRHWNQEHVEGALVVSGVQ
jgi:hypothetical protein